MSYVKILVARVPDVEQKIGIVGLPSGPVPPPNVELVKSLKELILPFSIKMNFFYSSSY
jgi:hypothetical protein